MEGFKYEISVSMRLDLNAFPNFDSLPAEFRQPISEAVERLERTGRPDAYANFRNGVWYGQVEVRRPVEPRDLKRSRETDYSCGC
ncbi:MAG TPA: hypothetical protein HA230_04515 [Candidatus Aenigmarchaeota archaeon]|nr:hypothetical protein [Candidatus Aenigmarchaeota archaeon]